VGSHDHASKSAAGAGVTPVSIATVQKGDIDVARRALGTVTPLANVTVRTQINGLLQEIAFKEGQIVQKGDFLAQIDPRPYQNALEQATGALQKDQALLKDAQLNLERFQKLLAKDSISKQQVDTQAALVDQNAGNVLADKGQIDAAQLNLTYAHITAPITGRIGLRQVDAGNYAQTSDANGIVTITQLQPITVIFTLPEDDVPVVMKLFNSGAELAATAYDRTLITKLATGRLTSTDNQIDPATGTVKLRAEFDNLDNNLFPNQFVNIELKISTQHDATLAPSSSIQRGSQGTFVYKLKDDDTVTVQPVKLGVTQNDVVAVSEGLAEGDKVVTQGVDKLRDGAHVAVK
jgi:multidrug efflux system membrane fusion protein